MRQGISRGHFGIRENFPDNVKVLEKKGPTSLRSRQFTGILNVRETFVVGDDGNRVRGSLNILLPFIECKDDGKEFMIIDIIVSFSRDKCLREVGTWVGVAIGVILKEDHPSSEEGSISHDGKGASYVRDGKDRSRGKGIVKGVKSLLLEWGQAHGSSFRVRRLSGATT